MDAPAKISWGWRSTANYESVIESGHGGADYYPMANFIRCIMEDTVPLLDVYKAVETCAPAILAAKSIEADGACLDVPDFRPNLSRWAGKRPPS